MYDNETENVYYRVKCMEHNPSFIAKTAGRGMKPSDRLCYVGWGRVSGLT